MGLKADWLADWLTEWLSDILTNGQTDWLTDRTPLMQSSQSSAMPRELSEVQH